MLNSTRNIARKYGAVIVAPVLGLASQAHAAVDADVLASVTGAGTDTLTVAAAVTVVSAALWAAMLIKRKFFG